MKTFKNSKEKWTIPGTNTYLEERIPHHNEIINEFVRRSTRSDSDKVAYFTAGGSGAGKSSFIEDLLGNVSQEAGNIAHAIDSDEIKEFIHEFITWEKLMKNPVSSKEIDCKNKYDFVHEESSDISYLMFLESVIRNNTFIFDGTFKNFDKYSFFIDFLKMNNYEISVVIIDVDVEKAVQRVKARAKETGRFVPEKIVRNSNVEVAHTFFKIKNQLPNYILYDNNGSIGEPKLIAEFSQEEGEIIYERDLYEKFKKKSRCPLIDDL